MTFYLKCRLSWNRKSGIPWGDGSLPGFRSFLRIYVCGSGFVIQILGVTKNLIYRWNENDKICLIMVSLKLDGFECFQKSAIILLRGATCGVTIIYEIE